jgi:hypothetical protein
MMTRDEVSAAFVEFANIPEYGLCCGDGWLPLLGIIARDISAIPVDDRKGFKVVQVKEKWGTLRFYYSLGKKRGLCEISIAGANGISTTRLGVAGLIGEIVGAAELASYFLCEECGRPGRARTARPYVQTLCDEHAVEKDKHQPAGEDIRLGTEMFAAVTRMLRYLSELWRREVTLDSLKSETGYTFTKIEE